MSDRGNSRQFQRASPNSFGLVLLKVKEIASIAAPAIGNRSDRLSASVHPISLQKPRPAHRISAMRRNSPGSPLADNVTRNMSGPGSPAVSGKRSVVAVIRLTDGTTVSAIAGLIGTEGGSAVRGTKSLWTGESQDDDFDGSRFMPVAEAPRWID